MRIMDKTCIAENDALFLVDRETFMMGSYAPKMELQSFITPVDEAPSGKFPFSQDAS